MAFQGGGFLEKQKLRRAMRRATDLALGAHRLNPDELEQARRDLQRTRQSVDKADHAVEWAMAERQAAEPIDGPEQCDWAWRPQPWTHPVAPHGRVAFPSPATVDSKVTLYHDCPHPELSYRQVPNTRPASASRYAIGMDVYRFSGSFISLVLDLPEPSYAGLTLSHFFAIRLDIDLEQELEIYARLNLQHGPNTEQLVREMDVQGGFALAEFDLAYTQINEKRMEKIWLDLIFEAPKMNRMTIWDVVMTRAPRADV